MDGFVTGALGDVIGRKELATDASKVGAPPVKSLLLKDPSQSRYIGNEGINSLDAGKHHIKGDASGAKAKTLATRSRAA